MATFTIPPAGFRISPELRLGPVRLEVADLSRSEEYYHRVIGLLAQRRGENTVTLGAAATGMPLVELRERPGARPVPKRGRLGLYHFALLLPGRAALGRFIRHTAAIGEQVGMSDHLVSEAVYLTDPDGLGIEVYADRPRSSWRVSGNAIAMAVDPLDIPDLLRAAGDEPWQGAPEGTRVGHVHLFVGDLKAAAAFYHDALGFDTVGLDFPGALFLSAGGYHHHLGTNIWAAGAPPAAEGDARLLEWAIELPVPTDVEAVAWSLMNAGYVVTRDGLDAVAADPWGTRVRLTVQR